MPSRKRKIYELHRENAKIAKTVQTLDFFLKKDSVTEVQDKETCQPTTSKRQSNTQKSDTPKTQLDSQACQSTTHITPKKQLTSKASQPPTTGSKPDYLSLQGRKTNSGHRISFNTDWLVSRPWLKCEEECSEDGHSYEVMFCSLCQKWNTKGANGSTVWNSIGCSSTRLDVVVGHETSVMHKEAISLELRTEANINTAFQKMNNKEFAALIDAQRVLYFLIEHNLPIHTLYNSENCSKLSIRNYRNYLNSYIETDRF